MKSSIYKKILTTAGAITAGLGILAGINAIVFRRATSDHLLEHEPGNLFHWRYGDVFYTVRGTGTPCSFNSRHLSRSGRAYDANTLRKLSRLPSRVHP